MRKLSVSVFMISLVLTMCCINQGCSASQKQQNNDNNKLPKNTNIKNIPPVKWFPFDTDSTWLLSEYNAKFSDGQFIIVNDAYRQKSSGRAVLSIKDSNSADKSQMVIDATDKELSINFLPFHEFIAWGATPIDLSPSIPILRFPILDNNSWNWEGTAYFIDDQDSVNPRYPAKATALIRNELSKISLPNKNGGTSTYPGIYVYIDMQINTYEGRVDIGYKVGIVPEKGIVYVKGSGKNDTTIVLKPISVRDAEKIENERFAAKDFSESVNGFGKTVAAYLTKHNKNGLMKLYQKNSVQIITSSSWSNNISFDKIPWDSINSCHCYEYNYGSQSCDENIGGNVDKRYCYYVNIGCSNKEGNQVLSNEIKGHYSKNQWIIEKYYLTTPK